VQLIHRRVRPTQLAGETPSRCRPGGTGCLPLSIAGRRRGPQREAGLISRAARTAVNETIAFSCFSSFLNNGAKDARFVSRNVRPQGRANSSQPRKQNARVVAFGAKRDRLGAVAFTIFATEQFPVNAIVTYTCGCAVRWPSGRRRRFAKPLYGPKPVSRVRIPASPPFDSQPPSRLATSRTAVDGEPRPVHGDALDDSDLVLVTIACITRLTPQRHAVRS
jgi:hypothetical protein